MLDALSDPTIKPDMQQSLAAMGLGLVTSGEQMMTTDDPEFDDIGMAMDWRGDGVRLSTTMSLTPKGAEIFKTATANRGLAFPVRLPRIAELNWHVDLVKALEAAAKWPTALKSPKTLHGDRLVTAMAQ